jgi:mycoredoxin-dependent peroxiredoxin
VTTEVLPVGAQAPGFALRDQHGRTVTLAGLQGRSHVLLVFFPAAFSSVCSAELCDLRDWWPQGGRDDTELLAVSCDQVFALRGYSDAEGIDYPLLSDFWPHGAVSQAYGVLDDSTGTSRRSSYLVDVQGAVVWSVHNARADSRPVQDYAAALELLNDQLPTRRR